MKLKSSNKKLILILILLLIVFPKKSGYIASGLGGYYGEKHSPCYGFGYIWNIPLTDSGSFEYCFGIPNYLESYCKTPTSPYREDIRNIRDMQRSGELDNEEAQERIHKVINEHEEDLKVFYEELNERFEKGEIDHETGLKLTEEKFNTTLINYTCGNERYSHEVGAYESYSWLNLNFLKAQFLKLKRIF